MAENDGEVLFEVRARLDKLEQDLATAESKTRKSSDALAGIAKTAAVAIGAAFVAAGSAAVKFGTQFENSMAAASTLIDTNVTDMDALNDKMLALSDSTNVAADELGNALYSALSAGIPATEDMSEAMDYLSKNTKLAKAGFTDIDTAVNTTAKILNAYNLDVAETDSIHKILMQTQNNGIVTVGELGSCLANVTPTAASMGVAFDQVGAALATMTAKGTPAAQATTQLNALFNELGQSGSKADLALRSLNDGMNFQALMESGEHTYADVVQMLDEYAGASGLSWGDMFGSTEAAKAAIAVTGDNAGTFDKNLEAMTTDSDVVGDAYDKVTDTTEEKFNKVLNTLKNSAIEVFNSVKGQIGEIFSEGNMEKLNRLIEPLKALVEKVLPPLLDIVISLIDPIASLAEEFMPVIETVITAIAAVMAELADPLKEIIQRVLPVLAEVIDRLLPPLMDIVVALLPPLLAILDAVLDPLLYLIEILLPPLETILTAMAKYIGSLTPLIEFLAKAMEVALGGSIERLRPTLEWLGNACAGFCDIMAGVIDFITGFFADNWADGWEIIKDTFTNIFEAIPGVLETVINTVTGLMNKLIGKINDTIGFEIIPEIKEVDFTPDTPKYSFGKDYVPEDNFSALLHRGEAVLTAEDADVFRKLGGKGSLERLAEVPVNDGSEALRSAIGSLAEKVGGGTNITQNNYSPKAINAMEANRYLQQLAQQLGGV